MNSLFYLAVDRLPLSTVGAIEFLGTVVLAAAGARTPRNIVALALAVIGVGVLTDVRLAGEPLGFVFAFANCIGFVAYVMLGHLIANTDRGTADSDSTPTSRTGGPASGEGSADDSADDDDPMRGIDQLAASMAIAAVAATPIGLAGAAPALIHPTWLLWGIGVGICSSVIPYVSDQLAMARLRRATFALMLALLPAAATVIGLVVLGQVPTVQDLLGIALVICGLALHHDRA
jgi:inner membrane transporter RhtA